MGYLFARLGRIKKLLINKFILLLLDYDGTLTPIAETPGKAAFPAGTKELLKRLSGCADCKIAVISGRSLKDLKSLVGIKGVIYAGNHGLEIEGPKIKFKSRVSPQLKLVIRNIGRDIERRLSGIKGALIEDKGLSLSIHYRLVGKKDRSKFEKIIAESIKAYKTGNKVRISRGKRVYEIRPPVKWDKGKVALWLLARQKFISGEKKVLPIFIGDDITDEDAFRALKRKGLTVFVGERANSEAGYYLNNTKEVIKFLHLVLNLKSC